MIPPSRTTSVQVLLTVGAQFLELELPGDPHQLETPFDTSAFDPSRPDADTRLNMLEARGEALWTAAFSGALGLLVERAATRAKDEGAAVTLRVIPAPGLPAELRWLPWEVLFDPQRRDFLSLKSGWSVVRGVDPYVRMRPLSQERVHVLVLTLDGPAANAEAAAISRLAAERCEAEVVPVNDAAQLTGRLAATTASIVHVIGAGLGEGLRVPGGDGYAGRREIGAAVAGNPRIGLVGLSGGDTALVAEAIAEDAKVTVLAHRTPVRDQHAAGLTETFYRRLLDGYPADVALTEARRALDRRFPGERAWTSAVLLTAWPPPCLPHPGGNQAGAERAAGPEVRTDAGSLTELLHTRNRDHARGLLAITPWDLVERQLREAERGLAELRARGGQ